MSKLPQCFFKVFSFSSNFKDFFMSKIYKKQWYRLVQQLPPLLSTKLVHQIRNSAWVIVLIDVLYIKLSYWFSITPSEAVSGGWRRHPLGIKKNRRDMIYMRGKKVLNVSKMAKKSRFKLVMLCTEGSKIR